MTELMKNMLYGVLSAVILSSLGGLWFGMGKAQAALSQLSINTQAIESIGTAMELRGIDRVIESKSKEIRDKEIAILNAKGNTALIQLLRSQNSELATEIEHQKTIRECVVDPNMRVCK